jgi:hypothetical protein
MLKENGPDAARTWPVLLVNTFARYYLANQSFIFMSFLPPWAVRAAEKFS